MECLVAIAVLGIMVGGITAMATASRATTTANRSERVDLLLTAFGEAVKNLPYVPCSTGGDYQTAFAATEGAQPAIERIVQAGSVTLTVGTVALGANCPETDPGTQTVPITAILDGAKRTGQIVKRDPSPRATQLNPVINSLMTSDTGAAQVVYQLDAIGSTPVDTIQSYDWDCGHTPAVDLAPVSREDDTVQCVYVAPAANSAAITKTVSLTVIDDKGRSRTVTKVLTVAAQTPAAAEPTSLFTYSPQTNVVTGNTLTFNSLSTPAPGGQLNTWEWDFGDNSSVTCTRPDLSCTTTTHKYTAAKSSYTVRLWVTDATGVRRVSAQPVEVLDAALYLPVPQFTVSPSVLVAPQRVSFDGSASKDFYGAAVTGYQWTFGDPAGGPNNTSTAAAPTHDYGTSGTYSVSLKVTAANGTTKTLVKAVVVSPLLAPAITFTKSCNGEFLGMCWTGATFNFQWTNAARPAGETYSYVFTVVKNDACLGVTNIFGQQSSTTYVSGNVGTLQTGQVSYGSPVCTGQFSWSMQTTKSSVLGTSNPVYTASTNFNL